jgi:hypothetical protein
MVGLGEKGIANREFLPILGRIHEHRAGGHQSEGLQVVGSAHRRAIARRANARGRAR